MKREIGIRSHRGQSASDWQAGRSHARRRFLREARAAAAIHHPNVVEILDVVEDEDGVSYIVQEFLRGEDARALIHRSPSGVPLDRALGILAPIVSGAAAAHAVGFVHRDVKPGNIFLAQTDDGRVVPKLLDFGVARGFGGANESTTTTTSVVGTPRDVAGADQTPSDVGPEADVWSLGWSSTSCCRACGLSTRPFRRRS